MKPVFMPSAPGKLTRRLLWVRTVFLPTCTWTEEKRSACSGNSTIMARFTGRGDLALVRKIADIGEMSARHAEMLRRLIHARDKRVLTAGDRLGDHDGDVVGGLHD